MSDDGRDLSLEILSKDVTEIAVPYRAPFNVMPVHAPKDIHRGVVFELREPRRRDPRTAVQHEEARRRGARAAVFVPAHQPFRCGKEISAMEIDHIRRPGRQPAGVPASNRSHGLSIEKNILLLPSLRVSDRNRPGFLVGLFDDRFEGAHQATFWDHAGELGSRLRLRRDPLINLPNVAGVIVGVIRALHASHNCACHQLRVGAHECHSPVRTKASAPDNHGFIA